MRLKASVLLLVIGTAGFASSPLRAQAPNELAGKARDVLKKYCHQCHGIQLQADMDVMNHKLLIEKKFVVAKDLDNSRIWVRAGGEGTMPPKGNPKPTNEDLKVLEDWITAGATAYDLPLRERPYRTELDILLAIQNDIQRTPVQLRQYKRYFTLTNLHNNPTITDRELRYCRAALSKIVNSLSWQPGIVIPEPVDGDFKNATIFRVDLSELGWHKHGLWTEILRAYPYGLTYEGVGDPALQSVAAKVYHLTDSSLPYVRADWFIMRASRPPLYHTLLYDETLPALRKRPRDAKTPDNPKYMKATDLEQWLGVDVIYNLMDDRIPRVARAGFPSSGISAQNRLVERHHILDEKGRRLGAYWKSYDFKPQNTRGNLFQFPLGPNFTRHPYPKLAFDHDGGEIIFNLPNKLQGYLLVNAKDERISVGPSDVVGDPTKVLGSTEIVNGVSCMICHKEGMQAFTDAVLPGNALIAGQAKNRVEQLYLPKKEMDKLVASDRERFLNGLEQTTASFVKVNEEAKKDIGLLDEPVKIITQFYLRDMSLVDVVCELDVFQEEQKGTERIKKRSPDLLAAKIVNDPELRRLGLAGLTQEGRIKREYWEQMAGTSTFHRAARQFGKVPNRP